MHGLIIAFFSYLGILLRFRPAFNDDNFFEERRIHIASLCRMMELIKSEGTNFLDMVSFIL